MTISPLAGRLLPPSALVDVLRLVAAYFTQTPDPADSAQRVAFGTSGHRGSSFDGTFNEAHLRAISQAVCQHRHAAGVDAPLFIGIDTRALSRPALAIALGCSPPTGWTRSSSKIRSASLGEKRCHARKMPLGCFIGPQ